MKLRIKGNTVRIRIMQTELKTLMQQGLCKEQVTFPNALFTYQVILKNTYNAVLEAEGITVEIPTDTAKTWAASEALSLTTTLPNGLVLLVEKDLACMIPREGEDDSDAFPNPATRK